MFSRRVRRGLMVNRLCAGGMDFIIRVARNLIGIRRCFRSKRCMAMAHGLP